MSGVRRLVPALVGGAAAAGALATLRRRPPGGDARWQRTNHRGEPITLLEGPALVIGVLAGAASGQAPARARLAVAVAAASAGGFGLLDDLGERGASKGLRGHLTALRRGQVTTGAVKVAGLAGTGLVTALLARGNGGTGTTAGAGAGAAAPTRSRIRSGRGSRGGRCHRDGGRHGGDRRAGCTGLAGLVADAALVAGTANLLNLLDLRPGRALKASLFAAPALALAPPAAVGATAAACGSAVGLLPPDLGERSMLGDTGANALGATLGAALVLGAPAPARRAALGVVTALTLASERVSFTRVIESTPVLREWDRLGRRPPVAAPAR